MCFQMLEESTGFPKCPCTNTAYIWLFTCSVTGTGLVAHIRSIGLRVSVNVFVTSKQSVTTESLVTLITRESFLSTQIFQIAGNVSGLVPQILHFSIINLLHTYNLICISEHPGTNIIQIIQQPQQRITQQIAASLTTLTTICMRIYMPNNTA